MQEYVKREDHPSSPRAATSASRLVDVIGIPRETVRRKLKILKDRGWIAQNGEQSRTLVLDNETVVAGTALINLDKRSIKRLARMYATF